jgi:uncharacterized protein YgiM (DUF1202 family)
MGGHAEAMGEAATAGSQAQDLQQAPAGFETLYVQSAFLSLRSGPSLNSQIVRVVPRGTALPNYGRVRSVWLKVGDNLFASSKHLQNQQGQLAYNYYLNGPQVAEQAPAAEGQLKVFGTAWLRVRSAPSNSAAVVSRLPQNATVNSVQYLQDGWVKIGEGQFVHGRFLRSTSGLAH